MKNSLVYFFFSFKKQTKQFLQFFYYCFQLPGHKMINHVMNKDMFRLNTTPEECNIKKKETGGYFSFGDKNSLSDKNLTWHQTKIVIQRSYECQIRIIIWHQIKILICFDHRMKSSFLGRRIDVLQKLVTYQAYNKI